ncbi:MAG: GNAT family N-acetyltransferase [Halovenus sp.]
MWRIAGGAGLDIDWGRQIGTLGVWLRKRFWGRRHPGERAEALLELAFEDLDQEVVAVIHHVDNGQYQGEYRDTVDE